MIYLIVAFWILASVWFIGFVLILFVAGLTRNSLYIGSLWIFIFLAMMIAPMEIDDEDNEI